MPHPTVGALVDDSLTNLHAYLGSEESPESEDRPLPYGDTDGHEHDPDDEHWPSRCSELSQTRACSGEPTEQTTDDRDGHNDLAPGFGWGAPSVEAASESHRTLSECEQHPEGDVGSCLLVQRRHHGCGSNKPNRKPSCSARPGLTPPHDALAPVHPVPVRPDWGIAGDANLRLDRSVENPGLGDPRGRAAHSVISSVYDRAALGTDKSGPARRIAAIVRWLSGLAPGTLDAPLGLATTIDGEELDGEANGTQRFDLVIDPGRDGLSRAGFELDVDRRTGGGHEAKPTVVNDDPSPGSCRDSVSPTQPGWHGVLVPYRYGACRAKNVGHLCPPAQWTVQGCPEPSRPAFGVENPCTQLEGWPVRCGREATDHRLRPGRVGRLGRRTGMWAQPACPPYFDLWARSGLDIALIGRPKDHLNLYPACSVHTAVVGRYGHPAP
jgi:hypothetical protein